MENLIRIEGMPKFCPDGAVHLYDRIKDRLLPEEDKCTVFVFQAREPDQGDLLELSGRMGSVLGVWKCQRCGKVSTAFRHSNRPERDFYSGCACHVLLGEIFPETSAKNMLPASA